MQIWLHALAVDPGGLGQEEVDEESDENGWHDRLHGLTQPPQTFSKSRFSFSSFRILLKFFQLPISNPSAGPWSFGPGPKGSGQALRQAPGPLALVVGDKYRAQGQRAQDRPFDR
ncbi:unnamed protein product, partial [marine sediment metagenome]